MATNKAKRHLLVRDSITLNPVAISHDSLAFMESNDFQITNRVGYLAIDDLVDSNQQIFPASFEFLIRKSLGLFYYTNDYDHLSQRQQKLRSLMTEVFVNPQQFIEKIVGDVNLFMQLYSNTFRTRIKIYEVETNGVSSHIFGNKTFDNKIPILLNQQRFYLMEKSCGKMLTSSMAIDRGKINRSTSPKRGRSPEKTIRDIFAFLSLSTFDVLSPRDRASLGVKQTSGNSKLDVSGVGENNDRVRNGRHAQNELELKKSGSEVTFQGRKIFDLRASNSIHFGIEECTSDIKKHFESFNVMPTSPLFLEDRSPSRSPSGLFRPFPLTKTPSDSLEPEKRFLYESKHKLVTKEIARTVSGPSMGSPSNSQSAGSSAPQYRTNQENFGRCVQPFAGLRKVVSSRVHDKLACPITGFAEKSVEGRSIERQTTENSFNSGECKAHKGTLRTYSASQKYGFIVTEDNHRAIVLLGELERAGAASRLLERSFEDLETDVRCDLQRLNGSNLRIYEAVNVEFC